MCRVSCALAICVLVVLPTSGQPLPRWVESVSITPTEPGGVGAVTLSGTWIDTCVPDSISHRIDDRSIELTVTQPGINVGCGDALTPWTLTEEIGPLGPGAYVVQGSLVAVDPANRNIRDRLSGPDVLGQIDPPRAEFHGLGNPLGDAYFSAAQDVSHDGRVVVGHNTLSTDAAGFITSEAFVWTPETGMFEIGLLPGGIPGGSTALAVSGDGNVVVGSSNSGRTHQESMRWTLGGGMEGLGGFTLPSESQANAVSFDGSVLVGQDHFAGPSAGGVTTTRAFRWTREMGLQDLGQLFPDSFNAARDVAANGQVIVGTSSLGHLDLPQSEVISEAFRWTAETEMMGLGHLPPRVPLPMPLDGRGGHALRVTYESAAAAVSANGSVIVGSSRVLSSETLLGGYKDAFRWTEETGMVGLEPLEGGFLIDMEAVDVSADGSVIVGNAHFRLPPNVDVEPGFEIDVPFIWDEARGTRRLSNVLQMDAGLDGFGHPDGWILNEVTAISEDGTTIVGTGLNPQGQPEAWRAVLSHGFAPGDADFSGFVDFKDFVVVAENFFAEGPNYWSEGDFNADGQVAFADFVLLAENFGPAPVALQASVPEPGSQLLFWAGAVSIALSARTRRIRSRARENADRRVGS